MGGVLLALKYKPKACNEVYNLGRGSPISVDKLVELLQKYLEKEAKIVKKDVLIYCYYHF